MLRSLYPLPGLLMLLMLLLLCSVLAHCGPEPQDDATDAAVMADATTETGPPADGAPELDGPPADGPPADGFPADGPPADGFPADGSPAEAPGADVELAGDSWPPPTAVDYVIVAADALAASAAQYQAFRTQTGHKVELALLGSLAPAGSDLPTTVAAIKAFVKQHYDVRDLSRPFYLLLLGDADDPLPAGTYTEPYDGTENTSDNVYADMDGDQIPDLAVGRIPAADDAEADAIRDKIAQYESTYEVGEWNRRINLFASTGGFGDMRDALIESLSFDIVESLSYSYDITFTYASQQSDYVYVPELFSDLVYARINEGSLITAYIGHGQVTGFDTLEWNGQSFPIFDQTQLTTKLDVVHKPPVFCIIACWSGAFDDQDALAEKILRLDKAPVAVIASTEISHPYANGILSKELAEVATEQLEQTAGTLLMRAKDRMINYTDPLRDWIDLLSSVILSAQEQEALKRTHLHMYALLGDPATRLGYVRHQAAITAGQDPAVRGTDLSVSATFSALTAGTARFTLESERTVILGQIDPVPDDTDPLRDSVIMSNYEAANNKVVVDQEVPFSASTASATLAVPADLPPGTYYLKVYAHDGVEDAIGHLELKVIQ